MESVTISGSVPANLADDAAAAFMRWMPAICATVGDGGFALSVLYSAVYCIRTSTIPMPVFDSSVIPTALAALLQLLAGHPMRNKECNILYVLHFLGYNFCRAENRDIFVSVGGVPRLAIALSSIKPHYRGVLSGACTALRTVVTGREDVQHLVESSLIAVFGAAKGGLLIAALELEWTRPLGSYCEAQDNRIASGVYAVLINCSRIDILSSSSLYDYVHIYSTTLRHLQRGPQLPQQLRHVRGAPKHARRPRGEVKRARHVAGPPRRQGPIV